MRKKLTSEDLNQITPEYLEKMRKSDLLRLTIRLRNLGIDLYERLSINSGNSSRPPSSDNPFEKHKTKEGVDVEPSDEKIQDESEETDDDVNRTDKKESDDEPKRNPGRQPGSKGF